MTTQKSAGSSCPKCSDPWPAEYAMAGKKPQWRCHRCGAEGELSGEFDGRRKAQAPVSPDVKRHWADRS